MAQCRGFLNICSESPFARPVKSSGRKTNISKDSRTRFFKVAGLRRSYHSQRPSQTRTKKRSRHLSQAVEKYTAGIEDFKVLGCAVLQQTVRELKLKQYSAQQFFKTKKFERFIDFFELDINAEYFRQKLKGLL